MAMRYNPRALKFPAVLLALSLLAAGTLSHAKLSPLAPKPDWADLDAYQQSITRDDFLFLLERVYAPKGAWRSTIDVGREAASIRTADGAPPYLLRFAPSRSEIKSGARFWRSKAQMPARPEDKPLAGVRIAIDPGHIGGKWAKMEERWFRIGNSPPVTEGDMTLYVAKMLVPQLKQLGAQVWLTRSKSAPVTSARPGRLGDAAADSLADKEQAANPAAIKHESELLFYRISEIRRRAELVNEEIKPDLVLCLHFNAEAWGNPDRPALTDKNHIHFIVNGCYSEKELAYDDVRFAMLRKLLGRAYREELAVSEAVASAMGRVTQLPAYQYEATASALKIGNSPFVWARNLAANRLFECPVVFVEPYVMNSKAVFARVQLGDYTGLRIVGGKLQKSIYREYADGIVAGLVDYYSSNP
jgi:N-acetylmuramoyl-L-alanine amidase